MPGVLHRKCAPPTRARRLPGQRRPGVRQTGRRNPTAPWPSRLVAALPPEMLEACEVAIAGPGFINFTLKPAAPVAGSLHTRRGRRSPPGAAGAARRPDLRRRLQLAQHGEADACRPSCVRPSSARPSPPAGVQRGQGHPRQPYRRLGHAVRQADLGLPAMASTQAALERIRSRNSSAFTSWATGRRRDRPGRARGSPRRNWSSCRRATPGTSAIWKKIN